MWLVHKKQATEGGTWAICSGAVERINPGTITTLWDMHHYYHHLMGEGAEILGNK